jgi:hypothetical protein
MLSCNNIGAVAQSKEPRDILKENTYSVSIISLEEIMTHKVLNRSKDNFCSEFGGTRTKTLPQET